MTDSTTAERRRLDRGGAERGKTHQIDRQAREDLIQLPMNADRFLQEATTRKCRPRGGGDPLIAGFFWDPAFAGTTGRLDESALCYRRVSAFIGGFNLSRAVTFDLVPIRVVAPLSAFGVYRRVSAVSIGLEP